MLIGLVFFWTRQMIESLMFNQRFIQPTKKSNTSFSFFLFFLSVRPFHSFFFRLTCTFPLSRPVIIQLYKTMNFTDFFTISLPSLQTMFSHLANIWSTRRFFYYHSRLGLVPTDQKTASADRGTRRALQSTAAYSLWQVDLLCSCMVLQPATATNRKAVFWSRAREQPMIGEQTKRERCFLFSSFRSKSVALHYCLRPWHRDYPADRRTNQRDERTDLLLLPSHFYSPRQCPQRSRGASASRADSSSLPHRRCLLHQPALRQDQKTASASSLHLVHQPRQSLLWRPSPTSSPDDFCCPTRRPRDLYPHRRRGVCWADGDRHLARFHRPPLCHWSLPADSVSLHASRS